MLAWRGTNRAGTSGSGSRKAPSGGSQCFGERRPPKNPSKCHHDARGGSRRWTQPEPKTTWKFLNPTLQACPQRVPTGLAAGTPPHRHPTAARPLGEQQNHLFPQDGDFWGSLAASRRPGQQPHVPTLGCPALSRIPNPSHMVSISLGSAGACWAVSELNFPLSFHAALGTGCSSSLPGPPPRCPFGHVSPGPGRVWGRRGRLLPPLCPQIAAWPCQRRGAARGGAGPGLFALRLALPRGLLPTLGLPLLGCRGQAQNVALPPQNAALSPAERGVGSVPRGPVESVFLSPRAGCFGPVRVILVVPPCFRN